MDASLRTFIRQFTRVVIAAALPVLLIAFLSIPYALNGHPGDERPRNSAISWHTT